MGHRSLTSVGVIATLTAFCALASPAMAQPQNLGVPSPESYLFQLDIGAFALVGGAYESNVLVAGGLDVDGLWRVSPRFSVNTQFAMALGGDTVLPRWWNQVAILATWRGLGDKWRVGVGPGYSWFNKADWSGRLHGPGLVVRAALPLLGGHVFAELGSSLMWGKWSGRPAFRSPESIPVALRLGWSTDVGKW